MNNFIIIIMLIVLLMTGGVITAQATNSPPKPQGRMKPPPEAIAACKGKSEGTSVQFTSPRGDTFTGVCKLFEGVLTAMPERGTPPPKDNKSNESNSEQSAK